LVGHNRERIVQAAARLLNDRAHFEQMARAVNPYGDGRAAERIVAWLLARLRGEEYPQPFEGGLSA
jgi:UDP-N-acetylglucosamine 2-epimerase (non-hydrolysing)